MSIRLMAQVWESYLPSSEKFVLLALADHARDDGSRVYPSIATIARKTGFSDRTVQRCMRTLQTAGVISIVKKSVRYGTTEYLIRGDKLSPLKTLRGDKYDVQGCHCVTPGVTNTTCRGDTVSPESLVEPSLNHKKNHKNLPSERSFRLAELLLSLILSRKPDLKKPNLQSWAKDIDRMIRLDNRSPDRIEAVIRWTQEDPFWQANILSAGSLREKFDRLELRINGAEKKPTSPRIQRPGDHCEDLSKYNGIEEVLHDGTA